MNSLDRFRVSPAPQRQVSRCFEQTGCRCIPLLALSLPVLVLLTFFAQTASATLGPVEPAVAVGQQPETTSTVPDAKPTDADPWLKSIPGLPKSPAGAEAINQFATTTELLGPLTPLALSPFFGITVLAGMTQIPADWPFADWLANNQLLGNNPVLKHPATFWIFLLLTAVTSIPRFTKVTKPVAQALDGIESYSGLITSLIILVVGLVTAETETSVAQTVVTAGILSFTINAFLLFAAIVNFLVVKSVRFLFEMLIWISPIPFVDACFEVANKCVCLALLLLYAFSPTLAFLINIAVFLVCLVVLNWARRRVNYHFHLWLEPWIQWWFPSYRRFDGHNLWVYCEQDFAPFRKYDLLHVYKWEDQWYLMRYDLFWKKKFRTFTHDDLPMLEQGLLKNALILQQQVPVRFVFHRGYSAQMDKIAEGLGISTKERVEFRNQKKIREADGLAGETPG